MANRKMLWARSHNRCALCRRKLTHDPDSPLLTGLVFGEEAHIVAQSPGGPRGLSVDRDSIDINGLDNLILLCPEDHKRIDDQPDVFTREALVEKKRAHEAWAESRLEGESEVEPIRVRKAASEEAIAFDVLSSGPVVWALIRGASVFVPYEFDDEDEARNDAADSFIELVTDWGTIQDAYSDSPSQVRHVKRTISDSLQVLWALELFALGRRLEGTISGGHSAPERIIYVELMVLTADQVRELQGDPSSTD